MVTKEVHVRLKYNGHREWISIFVIKASDPLILGYSWFHRHNPQIDWWAQTLVLNRCPAECQCWQGIIRHQLYTKASQSLRNRIAKDPLSEIKEQLPVELRDYADIFYEHPLGVLPT